MKAFRLFALLFFAPLALPASAQSPIYALSVSMQADRAGGISLDSATVTGSVYIFTSYAASPANFNPAGIAKVCYWLDNVGMSGSPTHCESFTPYDFANGSISAANPWSTTDIAAGAHTITQAINLSAGGTEIDTARFTIASSTKLAIMATWDTGAPVAGTVTLSRPNLGAPDTVLSTQALASGSAASSIAALDGATFYALRIDRANGTVLYQSPIVFGSPGAVVTSVNLTVIFRSAVNSAGQNQILRVTYQPTLIFP